MKSSHTELLRPLAVLASRIHVRLDDACHRIEDREAAIIQPVAHMFNGGWSYKVLDNGAEVFENDDVCVTVPTSAVTWKTAPHDAEHAKHPVSVLKWGSYSAHVREDGAEVFDDGAVRVVVDKSCVVHKRPPLLLCNMIDLLGEVKCLVVQLESALEDATAGVVYSQQRRLRDLRQG
jgi:hypothetical protein